MDDLDNPSIYEYGKIDEFNNLALLYKKSGKLSEAEFYYKK